MADLLVTVTCPTCGHAAIETMPTDRCVLLGVPWLPRHRQAEGHRLLRLLLVWGQALSVRAGRQSVSGMMTGPPLKRRSQVPGLLILLLAITYLDRVGISVAGPFRVFGVVA